MKLPAAVSRCLPWCKAASQQAEKSFITHASQLINDHSNMTIEEVISALKKYKSKDTVSAIETQLKLALCRKLKEHPEYTLLKDICVNDLDF